MHSLRERLLELKPRLIFVEADPEELCQLRDGNCKQHDELDMCINLPFKTTLVPIDASQLTIRRQLGHRLAAYPRELLGVTRAQRNLEVVCIEDVKATRDLFIENFPNAADLLLFHRERVMVATIKAGLADWSRARLRNGETQDVVAVIVGAAHAEAIEAAFCATDRAIEEVNAEDLAILKTAWTKSTVSALPVILLFYVALPLFFFGPWTYFVARKLRKPEIAPQSPL